MFLKKMVSFFKCLLKKIIFPLKKLNVIFSDCSCEVSPHFFELNKFHGQSDNLIPKVIWLYWHSEDNIPEIVSLCINRIKRFCPDYEVNFLNDKSVRDFISIPELPSSLPIANKSDYIRLKLLDAYGGIWMDSSIIINEDFSWMNRRFTNHDAFAFYSNECTLDMSNPITETWFIAAPKGNRFIKAWLDEFSSCIFSSNPIKYYDSVKHDKNYVQNLSKPDYLICYISAIKVLKENKFKILYASSESVGHYFNYKHKFHGELVALELSCKPEKYIEKVKLIKLTSGSREAVNNLITSGKVNKSSYIYNIINHEKNVFNEVSSENPSNRR